MKYVKTFEKFTNEFDFEIGKTYQYDDLPEEVQSDIDVQFDEYGDEQPEDYEWKFKLLPVDEIEEYVTKHFGNEIEDIIEEPYVQNLIKDIQERGLDYPSVGVEGNHRALVHWYLKRPLPYLEPIYKRY
jgi:hypothetical protein